MLKLGRVGKPLISHIHTFNSLRTVMSGPTKPVPAFAKNFPPSTASPSFYFNFPGCTPESTAAVRETVEENDRRHDIYERARFAHNHISHSLLTRYALGASPRLIKDAFAYDAGRHVSLDPAAGDRKVNREHVPDKITRDNWTDEKYLGQKDAYSAYLVFFHDEVARLGPKGVLDEYIFSPQANYKAEGGKTPGHMLDRLVAGVLHPFIHVGFGLEFRDQVMLAEGLAEAAVHSTETTIHVLGDTWPKGVEAEGDRTSPSENPGREQWSVDYPARRPRSGKSLLEIYGDVLASDTLKPVPFDDDMLINDRIIAASDGDKGEALHKLAKAWSLSDEELKDGIGGWEQKTEELSVLASLLACGTGRKGLPPRVDFFLMHALTSSIFLPAYMAILDVPQRRTVLLTYLLVVLLTAMARGRPTIDVDYLMSASPYPVAPSTEPRQSRDVLSNPSAAEARNAWLSLIESSLYAHDSHVPKAIRSLVHYDSLYGSLPAGGFLGATTAEGKEALPGIGRADGSIFVRGAGMIMDALGWCREGQKEGSWEFSPIGYDEVWKK